jgi:fructokinase
VVFGAILGTGVGGGIVVEGRILTGLNRIGGEWGHNPLPWTTESERPGHRCYCGKSGCIETFLSGAGLTREYFSLSGKELRAEQIAAAGQTDVIVLGGGISNIDTLYDGFSELIGQHAFSDGVRTRVVRAVHGDSSGVRGAAWLWPPSRSQILIAARIFACTIVFSFDE